MCVRTVALTAIVAGILAAHAIRSDAADQPTPKAEARGQAPAVGLPATGEEKPRILKGSRPPIPEALRGINGVVRMQLLVGRDGKVVDVTVVTKVHERLDAFAVAAAKEAVYTVPKYNGYPVYATVIVAMGF
jgi:outer membrane biosynthesis protein TonB